MKIKILDCKLLSTKEANKVDQSIRAINMEWWLRSPGYCSNHAAYVYDDGRICYYGYYVYYNNFAVRPALYLESQIGKAFKLADHNWINVFDNVYLCGDFIGQSSVDKSNKKVDYEDSDIQKFILAWFKSQGLEFNTEIELIKEN